MIESMKEPTASEAVEEMLHRLEERASEIARLRAVLEEIAECKWHYGADVRLIARRALGK